MIIGTYFFIAFIVFFFFWKIYAVEAIKNKDHLDTMFDVLGFHKAVWGSLFWIISIPMILIWRILEKLTNNKFN